MLRQKPYDDSKESDTISNKGANIGIFFLTDD